MTSSKRPITNPHLRRMWALAYVIPKRANPKPVADVWFAEARALLSSDIPAPLCLLQTKQKATTKIVGPP